MTEEIIPKPAELSPEVVYEQLSEDFRSLNVIFWNIPVLAASLNGGLIFAIASVSTSQMAQAFILLFLVVCNVGFVLSILRLRMSVMESILQRTRAMSGVERVSRRSNSIAIVFIALIIVTSVAELFAAFNTDLILGDDKTAATTEPLAVRLDSICELSEFANSTYCIDRSRSPSSLPGE